MIIIPPQGQRDAKPQTQHDTTVGMLVVALIFLGIAIFIFILGPRTKSPPPVAMPYVITGLAVLFGLLSFFSWMKEQAESLGGSSDGNRKDS